jgi:hypothetical protein
MKFKPAIIAVALLSAVELHTASASDRLSSTELKNLESICGDLLGKPFLSSQWNKLKPYLRDKKALKGAEVVCSGSCGGSFSLRGGLSLKFLYVNAPLMSEPWRWKECIVYSVTLSENKRAIFHRETEPKG